MSYLTDGVLVVRLSGGCDGLSVCTAGLLVDECDEAADVAHVDHRIVVLEVVDISARASEEIHMKTCSIQHNT